MRKIEELPKQTIKTIQRLIKKGCIDVIDDKINISDEMAEVLLILDRADVF